MHILRGQISICEVGFLQPCYALQEHEVPNNWQRAASNAYTDGPEKILDFVMVDETEDVVELPDKLWRSLAIGDDLPYIFRLGNEFLLGSRDQIFEALAVADSLDFVRQSFPVSYLDLYVRRESEGHKQAFHSALGYLRNRFDDELAASWARSRIKNELLRILCASWHISSDEHHLVTDLRRRIIVKFDVNIINTEIITYHDDVKRKLSEANCFQRLHSMFGGQVSGIERRFGRNEQPLVGLAAIPGGTLAGAPLTGERRARGLAKSGFSQISNTDGETPSAAFNRFAEIARIYIGEVSGNAWRSVETVAADHPVFDPLFDAAIVYQDPRYEDFGEQSLQASIEILERRISQEQASERQYLTLSLWRLGVATFRLAEIQQDVDRFNAAAASFDAALQHLDRGSDPYLWALIQGDLGSALSRAGERNGQLSFLERSIAAFEAAEGVLDPKRSPAEWASVKNYIGNACFQLGDRTGDSVWLEKSVSAYRQALSKRTRQYSPLEWAATMNNLANALRNLGEKERRTATLIRAVETYNEVFQVRKRRNDPLLWAGTAYNLASALRTLAQRENSVARVNRSIRLSRLVVNIRRQARIQRDHAASEFNLGASLMLLGQLTGHLGPLREAVVHLDRALEGFGENDDGGAYPYIQLVKGQAVFWIAHYSQDLFEAIAAHSLFKSAAQSLRLGHSSHAKEASRWMTRARKLRRRLGSIADGGYGE